MKKIYNTPTMDLQFVEDADVIVTSLQQTAEGFGDIVSWTPSTNN